VPLIAAGGICDGRGMAAAFALGAEAVQMGTRFVSSAESPVHANYKAAITGAKETGTWVLNKKASPCIRALKSERTKEIYDAGVMPPDVLKNILDVYFGGDMEAAPALAGQTVGLIDEVKTAAGDHRRDRRPVPRHHRTPRRPGRRARLLKDTTMQDLFSLEGRVALVTGGSRGIGAMIAKGFLTYGAKRVYITARKAAACDAAAEELSQYGECVSLPGDVSTMEGIEGLAKRIAEREDKLDILVNNAGAAWGAAFDEFPESGWDKTVDLNMKTPFFLTQALIGHLRAAGKDRVAKVINIARSTASR
jgi:hypothetical protein